MPIIVKCPSCRASLRIPSKVVRRGKDVHCPRCKSPVPVFQAIEYDPEPLPPTAALPPTSPASRPRPPAADDPTGDLVSIPPPLPPRPKKRKPSAGGDKGDRSRRSRRNRQSPATPEPEPPTAPLPPRGKLRPTPPEVNVDEVIDVVEVAPALSGDKTAPTLGDKPPHGKNEDRYGEDADDADSPADREQLEKARAGINLVYLGSCLLLAAAATALFATLTRGVLAACGAADAGRTVFLILLAVAGLVAVSAAAVTVVGQVFCCFAPPRHSAQLLAVLALVCSGGAILVGLASVPMSIATAGALGLPLMLVAAGLGLVHSFLFLFFLRAFALAIRAKWVAVSYRNLMIALGAVLVGGTLLLLIVAKVTGVSPAEAAALAYSDVPAESAPGGGALAGWLVAAVIAFGGTLSLFVWFERVLQELKDTVDSRLGWRLAYGTPLWVALMGAVGVLFFLNLILAFVLFMVHHPPEPPKKEPEPAPGGAVPLY